MDDPCMATKTITLELDAYEKLRAAKRGRESFSSVVRRVVIPGHSRSGAEVISYLKSEGPFFNDEELYGFPACRGRRRVAKSCSRLRRGMDS